MVNDYSIIVFNVRRGDGIAYLSRDIKIYQGRMIIHLNVLPIPDFLHMGNPWGTSIIEGYDGSFARDIRTLSLLDAAKADDSYKEIRILPSFFQVEHDICGTITFKSILCPEGAEPGNAIIIETESGTIPQEIRDLILMMSKLRLEDIYDTIRNHFISYVLDFERNDDQSSVLTLSGNRDYSDTGIRKLYWDTVSDFLERGEIGLLRRIINSGNDNNSMWISDRYTRGNTGITKSVGHKRRTRR